jgi:hypothetical protein
VDLGTTWQYVAEVAWEEHGTVRHDRVPWQTTVVSSRHRDSLIAVVVRGWPGDLGWYKPGRTPGESVLFCSAERAYLLGVDADAGQRGTDLVDSLLRGLITVEDNALIVQLPWRQGGCSGSSDSTRTDCLHVWSIDQIGDTPRQLRALDPLAGASMATIVMRTHDEHEIVDLVPHLGVTRFVYAHHGTVASVSATLIGFTRGRPTH